MTERQNIEWKQSWHDDYLKWICGFANLPCRQAGAIGGVIYIGKDKEGRVIGLSDYRSLMESIPQKIRNSKGIIYDINLLEENGLYYNQVSKGVAVKLYMRRDGIPSVEVRNDFGMISEGIRNDFGKEIALAFEIIAKHPEYTSAQIASELGKTSRTVENYIAKLKEAGIIERKGPKLGGHWEITDKK